MKKTILSLALAVVSTSLISQTLEQGINAIQNERYNQAKSILKNVIGTNSDATYHLGKLYYSLGKADSAKIVFEKGVSLNPKAPGNYVGLGLLALDNGKSDEAKKQFEIAMACLSSKDAKAPLMIGEAYSIAKNKDLNQAITYLTKATTLDKKSYEAQIALGDAQVQKPDGGGAAMTAYETAITLDPNKPIAYLKKGDLWFNAKSYDNSIESFKTGRDKDSSFAPFHRELGEIYYLVKRYDLAVKSYEKFLTLTEPTTEYKTRMAYFYFFNKQYDKVEVLINTIKKEDPNNNILNRILGYSLVEQGKNAEALNYLKEFFTKVDPKKILPSDYEYIGKAYLKSGNDSLAEINLVKTIQLDSSKSDLLVDLAKSYADKKLHAKAANVYKMKVKLPKAKSTDWFQLGRSNYMAFQATKTDTSLLLRADSAFTKVIEMTPTVHLGYYWRGLTNSLLDSKLKTMAAVPFYEKVIEIASADKTKFAKDLLVAYKYMGYVNIQKDDLTKAKEMYERALEVVPDDADAKKYLENVNTTMKTKGK
jgi:tetratricopeptide (TPR) repeat protein